jgi:hypothetical protein
MSQVDFARERLCIWPRRISDSSGDINFDLWLLRLNAASARVGECAISVDISPRHDAAAIGLYGDGINNMGHMQLLDFRFGISWIIDRLTQLNALVSPIAVAMGKATFASLETSLLQSGFELPESRDKFKRGNILILDGKDQAAAVGHIISAVNDGTFYCRPNVKDPEVLNGAVQGAKFRDGIDSVTWLRSGKAAVCPLVSVTNARYAFVTMKDYIYEDDQFFGSWR